MTESRFQFLQRDFPEFFALCEDASRAAEAHAALLKARMAHEHMAKDLGAKQRPLKKSLYIYQSVQMPHLGICTDFLV